MVYVMTIEQVVFRVGQTKRSLQDRVSGYTKVMQFCSGEKNLKKNEIDDGFRMRCIVNRRRFVVWAKKPSQIALSYIPEFARTLPALQADEDYLTDYYRPVWNNARKRGVTRLCTRCGVGHSALPPLPATLA